MESGRFGQDGHGNLLPGQIRRSLETVDFDFKTPASASGRWLFLNKGINITLLDERGEEEIRQNYCFEGGIRSFVEYLNTNKTSS